MTSEELQKHLEQSLRRQLSVLGSPEYALIWKQHNMPSGPPICALRASAHRTSGNDCSGWPTPVAQPANGTAEAFLERKRKSVARGNKMGICLSDLAMVAQLTGWPTPQSRENGGGDYSDPEKALASLGSGHQINLSEVALLAGWATPCTPREHDSDASAFRWNPNKKQADPVMQIIGRNLKLSDVPMEKRGALNPEFPRWLMGFPPEWGSCAPTETRLSRRSQRSS